MKKCYKHKYVKHTNNIKILIIFGENELIYPLYMGI